MTLHDYWDILRRSWLLVVATTVAGAAAALGLSLLMTPVYQAQAQLFVSVQSSDDVSGAYTGGLYVQQRIKSYVDGRRLPRRPASRSSTSSTSTPSTRR